MASAEVTEIMSGPLVQWLASCLDDPKALGAYEDLVDGVFLYQVFLQIDPEPFYDGITPTAGDATQRVKNLQIVFNNLKQFYEEELGHLIIKPPNTTNLGQDPLAHVQEARLMLLLLLGCAVQCPIKEKFITRIKNLDLDIQLKIVDCIKQVTDKSDIVIARETLENANKMTGVFDQIQTLTQERDFYREKLAATFGDDEVEADDKNSGGLNKSLSKGECEKNQNFGVELVDWKSKLREQRQRLDEKSEALLECKEELERTKASLTKVKLENSELTRAARTVQSYKDELDAITERAERADRLELEVQRYRQKLTDLEFYKTRIEELREDNRVLNENREMLEEQLRSSRRNTEKIMALQAQIIDYEKIVHEMSLERTADKEKFKELLEENCELHRLKKAAAEEAVLAGLEDDDDEPAIADNSLSEQLTNNAQARVLKLELENRRLMAMVDSFEEKWFTTTISKVMELQKEKNKLSLEMNSLSNDKENLSHNNFDLETLCEGALEENKKLQSILSHQRNLFERQQEDCQSQRIRIINLENNYDTLFKEKEKIQLLLESAEKRAEDLERSLQQSTQNLENFESTQPSAKKYEGNCYELEEKLAILEKEKDVAMRDVRKLHGIIENKDVALDRSTNNVILLEQKVAQLEGKMKNLITEITRLQEIENLYKDFVQISRTLESDLMAEKSNEQKLFSIIEKLGLNIESLMNIPAEKIFERIGEIPQVIDFVKHTLVEKSPRPFEEKSASENLHATIDSQEREIKTLLRRIKTAETSAAQLKSENAKLQATLATLQSQNVSQTSEHTNLQITNSQLAIEKEELMKNFLAKQRAHSQLVNDQAALQSLHEQLNNEYENVLQERESLKESLRGAKTAMRKLQGTCTNLEMENSSVNISKETAVMNANSLQILSVEHAKLKEDFAVLFTSAEKLKVEYKNLVGHYKKIETELNCLSLKYTEMQGELNSRTEKCTTLELEISKLNRSSEMLLQVNSGLESNRRSLMNHLSLLFKQYNELLVQSFQDKEQFHMEEKMHTDKINNLHRQKEKLEEKIMDHYRRLENCSMKKKKFGANLVEKVKKAGSDLLSKNRRSWAEDPSKRLERSKTSESESGGNESDVSCDYQNDAVIEFGKAEILEDKICRWVIEEQ